MKAITLWQPWASLWLTPNKIHETRSWATKHKGELAVHAAKAVIPESKMTPELIDLCCEIWGGHWQIDLPRGAIIGVVNIIGCYSSNDKLSEHHQDWVCGDFSRDRWLWRRGDYLPLAVPLPAAGKQRIWNGPEHVLGHGYAPITKGNEK